MQRWGLDEACDIVPGDDAHTSGAASCVTENDQTSPRKLHRA